MLSLLDSIVETNHGTPVWILHLLLYQTNRNVVALTLTKVEVNPLSKALVHTLTLAYM